jgi:hypothetical protein
VDPLGQRMKRIATLVVVLAVATAILAGFTGERVYVDCHDVVGCPDTSFPLREHSAGGLGMLLVSSFAIAGALAVTRSPRRLVSTCWSVVMLLVTIAGFAIWFGEHFELFTRVEVMWPEQTMGILAAAMLLLIVLVLPIVTWTAPRA